MSLIVSTGRARSRRVTLPWDCLLLVFKQCDRATLASLGRISFDILVVTAPLLYHDAEISSFTTLEQLFCERAGVQSSTPSRVDTLLSLDQVQTLRLSLWAFISPSIALSLSRLRSEHLSLHQLQIVLHWSSPFHIASVGQTLYECLLPLLRPTHVSWHVQGREDRGYVFYTLVTERISQYQQYLPWRDVHSVELKGGIPYVGGPEPSGILGMPRPTPTSSRTFRLHLATLIGEPYFNSASLLEMLGTSMGSFHLGLDSLQPGSVTLVVTSDAAKVEAENAVQTQVFDKYKPLFVVELET